MDDETIVDILESGNLQRSEDILKRFCVKFESKFYFGFAPEFFERLWKEIVKLLRECPSTSLQLLTLSALRILSRDKHHLNIYVQTEDVNLILTLSDLVSEDTSSNIVHTTLNYDVVIEAQKCLSNIVYNSPVVQRLCCTNICVPALMRRLKQYPNTEIPTKVKYFDMRLIFLLSALSPSIRPRLYSELHCFVCLIEIVEDLFKKQLEKRFITSPRVRLHEIIIFEEEDSELIIQTLKVLYNLVVNVDRISPDEEHERNCYNLVSLLRRLLLASTTLSKLTEEMHSNALNLLLVMPPKLYGELLQPMPKADQSAAGFCGAMGGISPEPDHIVEYDGKDMSAIAKILEFLHRRLKSFSSSTELIMPILTLMVEITQANRTIRKFVRLKILPPLRDVTKRPEEGESIRSRLCSLMTSPAPDLKQLSANLLFILCKENVERLIKYTGYGNAAGLLASRGMLVSKAKSQDYSSDSEDSETEEYERVKDLINPVTGRYEPPRPSPLAGMTDEQKEYEAMKLVAALDKLSRDRIIQPCALGPDGRPHPIESIVQLQQNLQIGDNSYTTDSDEEN